MKKIDCKRILVSCQPRYWNDSEVNGVYDIDFYESKGVGIPLMPCTEQIKDKPTDCIHSDHWAWRPIIDVETGQITNWDKQVDALVHYKVCDAFECIFQDGDGLIITQHDGYVPPFMYPKRDGCGDYIILDIDECGYIQHWDKEIVYRFLTKILNDKKNKSMTKTDIDSIVDWLIDQSFEGNIDIHNHTEFEENLRGVFRILYGMKCKNFFADGQCLKGGRCDGNCQRMKNYDKTH